MLSKRPLLSRFTETLSVQLGESDRPLSYDELAIRLGVSRFNIYRMASGKPCSARIIRKMADRSGVPRFLFLIISGYEPNRLDWLWDNAHYSMNEKWKYEASSALNALVSIESKVKKEANQFNRILMLACLFLLPFIILGIFIWFMPD